VALSAAMLVVFGPLLVRHSTYLTPDTIACFFVTAALYSSSMIVKTGATKWYVAAGIYE